MSLGSIALNVNPNLPVYIPYGASDASFSLANISSLTTNNIVLDFVTLDASSANGGQLLINNVPVATVNQNVSSITNWSSYPAVSTIGYTGNGGTANLSQINALTSVSTPQLFASTINGFTFPVSVFPPVISFSGASPIINGSQYNVDFVGQPPGVYMLDVSIQTGTGTDPMSCSAVIRYYGGNVSGGSLHAPFTNAGTPSFANCVSIQDTILSSLVSVYIYSTSNTIALGITPQFSVYRLT